MIKVRFKVWVFKVANRLLKFSMGLDLATIGMTSEMDRVTMLIYTTPELSSKATEAASMIAHNHSSLMDCAETIH